MRAAVFAGPRSIEVTDRPDPVIAAPTDAVVRVVLGCVCGSDLWYYRGESPHALGPIGHEFIGIVEEVGAEVHIFCRRRVGWSAASLARAARDASVGSAGDPLCWRGDRRAGLKKRRS